MKKFLLPVLLAGILAINTVEANNGNCPNCNKKMNKVNNTKAVNKTKKGLKHGYYDVTHNKVTKAARINQGNQKYKNRSDINVKNNNY